MFLVSELYPNAELMDQDLAAMYSTRTTSRTVAQSEIKSCVFDGLQTKEVVQSSYFAQETVETKTELLSPRNLFQKRNTTAVPDSQYSSPRKSTTPSKILSMIDESPSKLEIDKSPLAKNPFAKKTKTVDESPKLNRYSLYSELTILDSPNSKHEENSNIARSLFATPQQVFDNNPDSDITTIESDSSPQQQLYGKEEVAGRTSLEQLYATPEEEEASQRTEPASSQSSELGSDLGSQLDRFRFRRPLFKRSSQSDDALDSQPEIVVPKSPIFGKRKRNENNSPSKMQTTSRLL